MVYRMTTVELTLGILPQVPTRLLFLTVEFRLLTIIPRMLTVATLLKLPSDDGAPTYGPGLVNAGRRGLF